MFAGEVRGISVICVGLWNPGGAGRVGQEGMKLRLNGLARRPRKYRSGTISCELLHAVAPEGEACGFARCSRRLPGDPVSGPPQLQRRR